MEHLYSIKDPNVGYHGDYFIYDLFYLEPQARTFGLIKHENIDYYLVHLPHMYFMIKTYYFNGYYKHNEFKFGGSIQRINSIDQKLFSVPLPHAGDKGHICVSESSIYHSDINQLYKLVFDAFFENAGINPYMPYVPDFDINTFNACEYLQDNTPRMWKKWSKQREVQFSFVDYMIDPSSPELESILQKHAQEI